MIKMNLIILFAVFLLTASVANGSNADNLIKSRFGNQVLLNPESLDQQQFFSQAAQKNDQALALLAPLKAGREVINFFSKHHSDSKTPINFALLTDATPPAELGFMFYEPETNEIGIISANLNSSVWEWSLALAHEIRHAWWDIVKENSQGLNELNWEDYLKRRLRDEADCWLLTVSLWGEMQAHYPEATLEKLDIGLQQRLTKANQILGHIFTARSGSLHIDSPEMKPWRDSISDLHKDYWRQSFEKIHGNKQEK